MSVYTRRPEWSVAIRRPDYTKAVLSYKAIHNWTVGGRTPASKIEFVSSSDRSKGANIYTDLIGYNYENSLSNPAGAFDLTIVPIQDSTGLTWKDKIQARDIVFISEFGKVRYIGIVKGTGYSMSMNNGKPKRQVTINGVSIGGMMQSFNLPMNTYLWFGSGKNNEIENDKFAGAMGSSVADGQSVSNIFNLINEGFFSVTFGSSVSSVGFKSVVDAFFEFDADDVVAFYPMLLRPFQEKSNTLWTIYRQILPEPVYEIFGKYVNGKYKVVCRETPFDNDDWKNLPITELNPLYLLDQNINDTDGEVFTHFFSTMPNSAYSGLEVYALNELDEVSIFDTEKLPIYGYRQLEAIFPFYDLDNGDRLKAKEFLKNNSVRLYSWYVNNVEFQSGTITMMTVPEKDNNEYIDIGERIQYLKGANYSIEFYVEGIKRTMTYGDKMSSVYSVTRGYEYGTKQITVEGKSVTTPQIKKITQLGRKLIQSERDIFQEAGKL